MLFDCSQANYHNSAVVCPGPSAGCGAAGTIITPAGTKRDADVIVPTNVPVKLQTFYEDF
jgi:hypothetical protein